MIPPTTLSGMTTSPLRPGRYSAWCLLAVCLFAVIPAHAQDKAGPLPAAVASSPVTVLTGARLIDGTGRPPMDNAYLVFGGGRISAVGKLDDGFKSPAGATVIDARGRTIIPGLISAHSHLGLVKGTSTAAPENYTLENVTRQLDQYEGFGVTAVMSLGVNRDVLYTWRDEQRQGKLGGADIFTADRGIGVPGGAPPFPLPADQIYRPKNADEAREAVRETAARHPDLVKLWLDDMFGTLPKMDPVVFHAAIEEAHAAADEAHRHGLRVAAHLFYLDDAKALVGAGVDILAHSVRDQPVDAGLIDAMKARGVVYIPTLALDESQFVYAEHPRWMNEPAFQRSAGPQLLHLWSNPEYVARTLSQPSTAKNRAAFAMAMRNVKTLSDAGVPIAMGTDSGAMPTRLAGWGEHRELQLLVLAGLTPMQAIVGATALSARVIGQEADRGTLEPGKRADFLVLAADPLERIENTLSIDAIWHGGKAVPPITKRPVSAADQP